jgi:hypothetical protein
LALQRDAFLAAITGHPAALSVGDKLTDARLKEIAHAQTGS